MTQQNPRWNLQFDGHVRDRQNTTITDYHWELMLTVRYQTNKEHAEPLAAVRDRLFTEMRAEFGAVFFCKYAERIRVPLVQAVHQLTDALYCIESADAKFTSERSTHGWESNVPLDLLLMDIRAVLIPPTGSAVTLGHNARKALQICRDQVQDDTMRIKQLEAEVQGLKLDLFKANEFIRVHC